MYTEPILWMLSWPALIIISYQIIKRVVMKYEKKLKIDEEVE